MPLGKMGREEAEALLQAFGFSDGSCGIANVLTTVGKNLLINTMKCFLPLSQSIF